MILFVITIPIMLVAVAIAAVPLIAMSRSELREITAEIEKKLEHRRLEHQAQLGVETRFSDVPVLVGEG